MSDSDIQAIADEAAEKVASLSDVEEDVEVTITELPPGDRASKSGYVATRTEEHMGIGDWTGTITTGDVISDATHPQEVIDVLLEAGILAPYEA